MRTLRLSIVTGVLLLALAVPALAAYPMQLSVAVQRAYAPQKVKIDKTCKKTLGNQLYALVSVSNTKSGKAGAIAFQFINTAGWFAMWRDNKVLPAVPSSQRAHVRSMVNTLRAKCS